MVKAWADQVDAGFDQGLNGRGAIQGTMTSIDSDLGDIQKKVIDIAKQNLTDLKDCSSNGTDEAAYYSFSHIVQQQLDQFSKFIAKAKDLKKGLQDYTNRANWTGPNDVDYIIGDEVKPTMQNMQKINIKVAILVVAVDPDTGALATTSQNA